MMKLQCGVCVHAGGAGRSQGCGAGWHAARLQHGRPHSTAQRSTRSAPDGAAIGGRAVRVIDVEEVSALMGAALDETKLQGASKRLSRCSGARAQPGALPAACRAGRVRPANSAQHCIASPPEPACGRSAPFPGGTQRGPRGARRPREPPPHAARGAARRPSTGAARRPCCAAHPGRRQLNGGCVAARGWWAAVPRRARRGQARCRPHRPPRRGRGSCRTGSGAQPEACCCRSQGCSLWW